MISFSNIGYSNNQIDKHQIRERIDRVMQDHQIQPTYEDDIEQGQAASIWCKFMAVWIAVVISLEGPKVLSHQFKNK